MASLLLLVFSIGIATGSLLCEVLSRRQDWPGTAGAMLRNGDLLAICPEGGITMDGELQPFKDGIMKILENAERDGLTVPVVPMALTNFWGSFFSRIEQGGAMVRPFRRGLLSRVGLNAGPAMTAAQVQPDILRARVLALQKA